MKRCFIVLALPEGRFLGVHQTIDGAVHHAAGLGATAMPGDRPITVDAVAEWMKEAPTIILNCALGMEFTCIGIERHAIVI